MTQNSLRIGYVVDDSLDSTDGVQQYVLTVSQWMREQGHECHFLVGRSERQDLQNIHNLSKVIGVKFNKNRMSTPLPASKKAINNVLKKHHFDIIHVQMPFSPLLAGKVLKQIPETTAVIGTFHILPFGKFNQTANTLLAKKLKKYLRRFDEFVSVSKAAQGFAKLAYGIDSEVIPNAVDSRKFVTKRSLSNEPQSQPVKIVFLGRLVERKGAKELLEALAVFQDRYPAVAAKIECIIGGKGKQLDLLKKTARDNNLDHMVKFTGFVAEEDKAKLLSSADIAVFPALGGESFGIVLIEAMAAGAGVVIGGDNPGYRSVLGARPELLVNPSDKNAFADKLYAMLKDKELREDLNRWQQRTVRQYDIAQVGPKLLSYYQRAITKRTSLGQS